EGSQEEGSQEDRPQGSGTQEDGAQEGRSPRATLEGNRRADGSIRRPGGPFAAGASGTGSCYLSAVYSPRFDTSANLAGRS
ncbi:MAG: hypothetical protein JRE43_00330, partial [Deltaproteobacteria bacterium]|nr:hypothetical protein [Deltaproteobacteria bacterium]